jgi:acyl-CoA synthetase (AMP-forming)/AMP-acid ligase II
MEFCMSRWAPTDFATVLTAIAGAVEPGRPALVHGERTVNWQELDRLTSDIAAGLLASGLKPGDVVGHQLRNGPAYMIAFFACAKAGLIPVNVNYHYRGEELADIVTRFRIAAIIQDSEFATVLDEARAHGAVVTHVFTVDGEDSFGALAACGQAPPPEWLGDGLFYVATGGTTGMPKAAMWRHADAWEAFGLSVWPSAPGGRPVVAGSLAEHVALAAAAVPPSNLHRTPFLMLSPLMHGAGLFSALICLLRGGTLVTMASSRFDADATIDEIARGQIVAASFVGDAFALPLADALEARDDAPDRIASLRFIVSSGATFSNEAKQRLLAFNAKLTIIDALGSSESAATAIAVTTAKGTSGGKGFGAVPGRPVKIFDEALNELAPGSEAYGILARSGPLPLGYLGEDALNTRTFPTIDGVRYLMTGDRARLTADGRIEFAGRDNLCINTGGEKVFPEEVEAVLQRHPAVRDARIIGLPDPRFGRRIAAVVAVEGEPDEAALDAHCRASLAGYKIPRRYIFTTESLRLNNGKPDYKAAARIAGVEG